MTQSDFAKRYGLSQQAWAQYEIGRRQPKLELLARIGVEENINLTWLITGIGEMSRVGVGQSHSNVVPRASDDGEALVLDLKVQEIPFYRDLLDSDGPTQARGAIRALCLLPEHWLDFVGLDPARTFLAEVRGDGMDPRLPDGELVLGELTDQVGQNGIYAVMWQGYLSVITVLNRPDGIYLKDNYDEYRVEPDHPFRVIGRVERKFSSLFGSGAR